MRTNSPSARSRNIPCSSLLLNGPCHKANIDLNVYDLEMLFQVQSDNDWTGLESLYNDWFMVNLRHTPSGLDTGKFTATYPNWRKEMIEKMDLQPDLSPSESSDSSSSDSDIEEIPSGQKQNEKHRTTPDIMTSVPATTSSLVSVTGKRANEVK